VSISAEGMKEQDMLFCKIYERRKMEADLRNISIEPLLRASEVATRLNISRSLAYKLIQLGEIPSVRVFKSVRVRVNDLEEYIRRKWSGWQELTQETMSL
jgi:excisionase family DNA binding protein